MEFFLLVRKFDIVYQFIFIRIQSLLQILILTHFQPSIQVKLNTTMRRSETFHVAIRRQRRQEIFQGIRQRLKIEDDANRDFHQYLEAYDHTLTVPRICAVHFEMLSETNIMRWLHKAQQSIYLNEGQPQNVLFMTKMSITKKLEFDEFYHRTIEHAEKICSTVKYCSQRPDTRLVNDLVLLANSLIDFWGIQLALDRQVTLKDLHVISKTVEYWWNDSQIFSCLSKVSLCRLFQVIFSKRGPSKTAHDPITDSKCIIQFQNSMKRVCQPVVKGLIFEKFVCPKISHLILLMNKKIQFLYTQQDLHAISLIEYISSSFNQCNSYHYADFDLLHEYYYKDSKRQDIFSSVISDTLELIQHIIDEKLIQTEQNILILIESLIKLFENPFLLNYPHLQLQTLVTISNIVFWFSQEQNEGQYEYFDVPLQQVYPQFYGPSFQQQRKKLILFVRKVNWARLIISQSSEILVLIMEILVLVQPSFDACQGVFIEMVFVDGQILNAISEFVSNQSENQQKIKEVSTFLDQLLDGINISSKSNNQANCISRKSHGRLSQNLKSWHKISQQYCLPTQMQDKVWKIMVQLNQSSTGKDIDLNEQYGYEQIEI